MTYIFPFSDLHAPVKKLTCNTADKAKAQCKEEKDPIPIIKINSVCSMASPASSPQTEVTCGPPCHVTLGEHLRQTSEMPTGPEVTAGLVGTLFH